MTYQNNKWVDIIPCFFNYHFYRFIHLGRPGTIVLVPKHLIIYAKNSIIYVAPKKLCFTIMGPDPPTYGK